MLKDHESFDNNKIDYLMRYNAFSSFIVTSIASDLKKTIIGKLFSH